MHKVIQIRLLPDVYDTKRYENEHQGHTKMSFILIIIVMKMLGICFSLGGFWSFINSHSRKGNFSTRYTKFDVLTKVVII